MVGEKDLERLGKSIKRCIANNSAQSQTQEFILTVYDSTTGQEMLIAASKAEDGSLIYTNSSGDVITENDFSLVPLPTIVQHKNISGTTGQLLGCSGWDFVWSDISSGSFTITNVRTGEVTTYSSVDGVTPANSFDYGLETVQFDATAATGLYLNLQGCEVEDIPLTINLILQLEGAQ